MEPVQDSDPTTFNCSKDEIITVTFSPDPADALGAITYCFKQNCSKADQKQVEGNQFSFTINKPTMLLQLFFFFIPGQPLGKCDILFTSSTGQTYTEPATVEENTTGVLPSYLYIFKMV